MKVKTCSVENCEQKIWARKKCKMHDSKDNPPKKIAKQSTAERIKAGIDKIKTENLHRWFDILWENEPHYSEISNAWLGSENKSLFWHHILPKAQFPQYAEDRDNIIRLTGDEHAQVEANPYFYEEVNIRRENFKKNHDL